MIKTLPQKIDKFGATLSAVCLVHCLILPVLLATVPFIALLGFMKNPLFEMMMIIFGIFNASFAVCASWKKHKNIFIFTLFSCGLILFAVNVMAHSLTIPINDYTITCGAALMGWGHLLNHKLCKNCSVCHHE